MKCLSKRNMISIANTKRDNLRLIFWLTFAMHIIIFSFAYGLTSLNVAYTEWMIDSGDLGLEYFGSLFYARSKWTFPIGLMNNLTFPYNKSVVYFDALPLLALTGKVLKNFLPDQFQLWGIYSFLTFGLQGALGACCIYKFIKVNWICIMGSLFFSMQMIFLSNIYTQIPLSSHWILLCAFLIALYYGEMPLKKRICFIGVISTLTIFIQTAFLPMVLCILFFRIIAEIGIKRTARILRESILIIAIGLIGIGLAAWILGIFYTSTTITGGGLGNAAIRLDSFIDPMGGGVFLPTRSSFKITAVGYVGFGTILLISYAIIVFIVKQIKYKKFSISRNEIIYLICAFMAMVISVFFALSPIAKWGDKVIYEIPLNDFAYKLWSTVRSSYRLVWPVIYGALIFAVWLVSKIKCKWNGIILGICVLLQIIDLIPFINKQVTRYNPNAQYESELKTDAWEELAKTKDKIIFMNGDNRNNALSLIQVIDRPQIYDFAYYAYCHEMMMSDFYYARKDSELMNEVRSEIWHDLYSGEADTTAIYLFLEPPVRLMQEDILTFYWVDNYLVGITDQLTASENVIRYCKNDPISILPVSKEKNSLYFENGIIDEEGHRVLYQGGKSFGPKISLDAGKYSIKITGQNLEEAEVECISDEEKVISLKNLKIDESQITYEIYLNELVYGIDFVIENKSDNLVIVNDMEIANED